MQDTIDDLVQQEPAGSEYAQQWVEMASKAEQAGDMTYAVVAQATAAFHAGEISAEQAIGYCTKHCSLGVGSCLEVFRTSISWYLAESLLRDVICTSHRNRSRHSDRSIRWGRPFLSTPLTPAMDKDNSLGTVVNNKAPQVEEATHVDY